MVGKRRSTGAHAARRPRSRLHDVLRDAGALLVLVLIVGALTAGGLFLYERYWPRTAPAPKDPVPSQYRDLVLRAGQVCAAVPSSLIAAQIDAESGWDPRAESPAGAQGIAQFTPDTWERYGGDHNQDGKADVLDPADAIPSQAGFMCQLAGRMQRLKNGRHVEGELQDLTLAAYNAGPEAVVSAEGVPRYPETMAYVARIGKLRETYEPWLEGATDAATASGR